jgi:hypothetical protein
VAEAPSRRLLDARGERHRAGGQCFSVRNLAENDKARCRSVRRRAHAAYPRFRFLDLSDSARYGEYSEVEAANLRTHSDSSRVAAAYRADLRLWNDRSPRRYVCVSFLRLAPKLRSFCGQIKAPLQPHQRSGQTLRRSSPKSQANPFEPNTLRPPRESSRTVCQRCNICLIRDYQ